MEEKAKNSLYGQIKMGDDETLELSELSVAQLSSLAKVVLEALCKKLREEEEFADRIIVGGTITSSESCVQLTSCDYKTPNPVYTPAITIY